MGTRPSTTDPQPVRVGYLIDDLGSGGAQRQLVELVCRLDRARYFPHVYCYAEPTFYLDHLTGAGVPVTRLFKHPGFDFAVTRRMAQEAYQHTLRLFHAFLAGPNLYAALAARLVPGLPSLASERSSRPSRPWRLSALEASGYHLSRHVIANSERGARQIMGDYRLPARKVTTIPNGVDVARFSAAATRREEARAELGLGPGERLLLMVGRPSEEKDPLLVLEALGRVRAHLTRPFRLLVVGGEPAGQFGAQINAALAAHGLSERVGFLPARGDIERLYAACDILLLSSRYEGCPNVVMEAAAAGRAVVASDVGDVPSLVRDGVSGRVFPAGDADALADALRELDAAPDARLFAMGEAGAAWMRERFGMDRMVARTMDLYDRVLAPGRASAPDPRETP